MGRHAAFSLLSASYTLLLLSLSLKTIWAEGNIGCLFSETLCNQEKEWCFDDYAFGRCLTLYGNVQKEDMHRYNLGTSQLHLLEQEMQRLFLLGYRWSHTYTQCVLQALLTSIKAGTEFDVSSCNAELDQDLEGALKAIEGEEMDHIDPHNLAIVRFTPSVLNPHSDYADELYYPPLDLLPPIKGKGLPPESEEEEQKEESKEQAAKETTPAQVKEELVPLPPHTTKEEEEDVEDNDISSSGSKTTHHNSGTDKFYHNYNVEPFHNTDNTYYNSFNDVNDNYNNDESYNSNNDNYHTSDNDIYHDNNQVYFDSDNYHGNIVHSSDDAFSFPSGYKYNSYDGFFPGNAHNAPYHSGTQGSIGYVPDTGSTHYGYDYDDIDLSPNDINAVLGLGDSEPLGPLYDEYDYNDYGWNPADYAENVPVYVGGPHGDFDYDIGYDQRFAPSYYKHKRGYDPDLGGFDPDLRGYQMDAPTIVHDSSIGAGVRNPKTTSLRDFAKKLATIRQFDEDDPKARTYETIRESVFFPQGKERIFPPRHQRVREPEKEEFYEGILRNKPDTDQYYFRDKEIYVMPKEMGNPKFSNAYMNNFVNKDKPLGHQQPSDTARGIPLLESPDEADDHPDSVHPPYRAPDAFQNNVDNPHEDTFQPVDGDYNPYQLYNTNGDIHDPLSFVEPKDSEGMSENSPSKFSEDNMAMANNHIYPPDHWMPVHPHEAYPEYARPSPNQYKSTSFGSPFIDGNVDSYATYGYQLYPDYEYTDFYDDYGGRGYMPSNSWYNLQREERPDVKKPGPFFHSDNDVAFDYANDQIRPQDFGGRWMDPMADQSALIGKVRQVIHDEKLGLNKLPGVMLTEEGMRGQEGQGMRPGDPKVGAHGQMDKNAEKVDDRYVYITIGGKLKYPKEGRQLVDLIMSLVKADSSIAQDIRVKENQVRFRVRENDVGLTAALLAEWIQELRSIIKGKTGLDIIQAGVGTETTLRAVVFNNDNNHMMSVVAIVLGVFGALLTAALMLYILKRNSKALAKLNSLTQDSEASKTLCGTRGSGKDGKDAGGHSGTVGKGQRLSSLSKESDNGGNSPSSRSSTSSWSEEPVPSNMDIATGHMVLSYMEDHLKNKDRLEKEWTALCSYEAKPCATNVAKKPENIRKNRYSECVPYDHNRVILNEHTNVIGSNYVNASSITDHDPRNPAYIATQGPLAATASDFWQLVWEQGSVVIVMLTRLSENGLALCHRYWPEEGSELYHIYEVHLVSEHTWCDDYLVRSFYLKNLKTGETRTVTQFHFLSWPEVGVPTSTKAMLEFRRKVNKSYRGRSCPIIVHCSDGVGRTGTYCLIDMVLNRMVKGAKEIDIAATLEHIRDQRPHMVKTKLQFEFVLMAVAEEVHAILKALPQ